jgi:DNA-binding MarR family transcriptional regulator
VFRRKKDQYDRRKCVITIAPEAAKAIEYVELDILCPIYRILKMVGVEETRKWVKIFRQIEKEMETIR